MGKAGSEADGLRDSLTIGKESDWRIEILEEERKVRISSHKSLSAIFRDLTLDQGALERMFVNDLYLV